MAGDKKVHCHCQRLYDPERKVPLHSSRLLKNAHLLRFPHPSSLRRTSKYASFLRISGALHLGVFEQPTKIEFFSNLLGWTRARICQEEE